MRNWFDAGGESYARFRPDYPTELCAYLASVAPAHDLAIDVGCGTGQLTTQLADRFASVVGLDPSAEQIAHATPRDRVRYVCAPAEHLPIPAHGAALIAVAQAAHWFDLPAFYREARRVGAPRAILALISYGILELDAPLAQRFGRFYRDEIGPFWPPQRRLVDDGYASIDFPFEELTAPALAIRKEWTLTEFLGYVSTWSAVRRARESGAQSVLERYGEDLAAAWGEPSGVRRVSWPIHMRVGRL